MMRRPVVLPELVAFMRERQAQLTGELAQLQAFARAQNIPVIPHETVVYFQFLLGLLRPKKILEVGTAIGFSTLLLADSCPNAEITTLERYEEMLIFARKNLSARKNIHLIEGEAAETLEQLTEPFDFIFMDSAKTQYVKFLPRLLALLSADGVLIIDDVFQAGDILQALTEIPRRERNIIKGLNALFDAVFDNPHLQATLVPLGDGLLMIRKK